MTNPPPLASNPPRFPAGQPVHRLDGADLRNMIGAGYSHLKQYSHIVNALNVFPVPDGDTGTNMVLTMQSAWKMMGSENERPVSEVIQALANGAVRGARGNSGVILSQILRGMAENLRSSKVIDAAALAAALQQAKETAYKGVLKPVEGTILTVIREAASAAGHAAAISADLRFVLETTLVRAQQALANTPNLLPVLKQAGVVDAGGQGLCYMFEGMARYLRGETLPAPEQVTVSAELIEAPKPNLDVLGPDEWGYDIQFLVFGASLDEAAIRERLLEMGGDSVVVGKAGAVVKVHVHSPDPGPFLSYGASLGQLDDIVLENMTLQTLRRKGEWQEDKPAFTEPELPPPGARFKPGCPGIVAVASGDGLRKVFESLGVCAIVSGGQTLNPSTEDLLKAAEQIPHDDVIVLPNNKNIILAARQAAQLSSKRLHVLETKSMPQGIAAMLGFSDAASVEENVQAMMASAHAIHTAEITEAVRAAQFDGITVQPGDLIGIVDGQLRCKASTPTAVVLQALALMDPDGDGEIFTLYWGEPVTQEEAEALAAEIEAIYPDHTVELLHGGQPHYHYLISAE